MLKYFSYFTRFFWKSRSRGKFFIIDFFSKIPTGEHVSAYLRFFKSNLFFSKNFHIISCAFCGAKVRPWGGARIMVTPTTPPHPPHPTHPRHLSHPPRTDSGPTYSSPIRVFSAKIVRFLARWRAILYVRVWKWK